MAYFVRTLRRRMVETLPWTCAMSLLAKKLLLVVLWFGAIWTLWSPWPQWNNSFLIGREGMTEYFGFADWYYVSVRRLGAYGEGVRVGGIAMAIAVTILVTLFVLVCYRRLERDCP